MQIRHEVQEVFGSTISTAVIETKDASLLERIPSGNLWFTVTTYRDYSNITLVPLNTFLESLTPEESARLVTFFVEARLLFDEEFDDDSYKGLANKLGELFYQVALSLDLADRLVAVAETMPIPDLSNIGGRVQDTEEFTFREPEYYRLTAISLCCKLLSPVWGEFISATKGYIESSVKEVYCYDVIAPLLSCPILETLNKRFINYVSNIVTKRTNRNIGKENIDFIIAHSGYTKERFRFSIYAILLVKRLVNVDLLRPGCNIMKYIMTSAESQLDNQLKTLQRDANLHPRKPVREDGDQFSENSTSALEHESSTSRGTADIPTIVDIGTRMMIDRLLERSYVDIGTRMMIDRLLERFYIDRKQFENALSFYSRNVIVPSVFNLALASTLIGRYIGGAYSMKYLPHETYTKLIIIAQLHMAHIPQDQLSHLLTCRTSPVMKHRQASSTDARIIMNSEASAEYRMLKEKVNFIINNRTIETQIRILRDWVINYDHFYNTAPIVRDILNEEQVSEQGVLIDYSERVVLDICGFMTASIIKQEEEMAHDRVQNALVAR